MIKLILGRRVAIVRSVDGSPISCFTIHECEGPTRVSTRPRRYIFTGHDNGSIQLFDLTTAIELRSNELNSNATSGGPTAADLLKMLDRCDFAANSGQHQQFLSSRCPTPCCQGSNQAPTTVSYTTAIITPTTNSTATTNKDELEKAT